MPIEIHHVAAIVNNLGQEIQIRKTVNNSLKAAAVTGIATLLGGLIAGRRGILAGAAGGGLLGMAITDQDFVGLPTAFNRLPVHVQERIATHFRNLIEGLEPADMKIIVEVAGALANGADIAQLGQVGALRNVFANSVDFIREQILEEQRVNPNFLV